MGKPPPMTKSNKAGFVVAVAIVVAAVAISQCDRKYPAPVPSDYPRPMLTAVQK